VTRSDLIIRVKIKLDEYTPSPGVALPFESYISPLLDESANDITARGPLRLLLPIAIPLTGVAYLADKSYIPVPVNYVKLYEIKYPLWKKSVRIAISQENPAYKIQENEYIKGGYARPSVAEVIYNGIKHFECGKVVDPTPGTLTPIATYVKTDVAENLNDLLVDSLTWLTVSKIFVVTGYGDKAKITLDLSNQALAQLIV
jgi:hypothetical protein